MIGPWNMRCIRCGKEVVRGCVVELGDENYCDNCNPMKHIEQWPQKEENDER